MISPHSLYWFKKDSFSTKSAPLRMALQFIKQHHSQRPLGVSFCDAQVTLFQDLSLKENIFIDALPIDFSKNKDRILKKTLTENVNIHLEELYQKISPSHLKPAQVPLQIQKLAGLVRALLRPGPFFIFDRPEKYLASDQFATFQKALWEQLKVSACTALVFSDNKDAWDHLAPKDVSYSSSEGKFKIEHPLQEIDDTQHKSFVNN